MGTCASSQQQRSNRNKARISWPMSRVQVISSEGKLEEYKPQVSAGQVLAQSPECFLCSAEAMLVGARAPKLPATAELQAGQIYFLLHKTDSPLSLQDLCSLAVKASAALKLESNEFFR